MNSEYLFTKLVDKSALNSVIQIPIEYQDKVYKKFGYIGHRARKSFNVYISVINDYIEGIIKKHTIILTYPDFKKSKRTSPVLEICYSKNSELSDQLKSIFLIRIVSS